MTKQSPRLPPPTPPPEHEKRIGLGAVVTHLRDTTDGTAAAPVTVNRWITKGVVKNGQRVRLEAERRGSRWFTTLPALSRFFARCAGGTGDEPRPLTAAQRKREYAQLEIKAEAMGLLPRRKTVQPGSGVTS